MMSNLPAAQSADLAFRRDAHEPLYTFIVSEAEAQELSEGRVPELIQRNAAWALESLEVMVTRKQKEKR